MNNILYQSLPEEWHGYRINTGFHIGVQISLLMDDETVNERIRNTILVQLLFGNESGEIGAMPGTMEEVYECVEWFMRGWNHDKESSNNESGEKVMDYDVDQGRIYADFMSVYGIDLEVTSMHWWKFQWLLWNMPAEQSSFHQVIKIRTMKPRKGASREERQAIIEGKKVFGLKQKAKKLSKEEIEKIEDFDNFMKKAKNK